MRLGDPDEDLEDPRLALALLTAFPPDRLADDDFVSRMKEAQADWAGVPDPAARHRAATFISTYQDRLPHLAELMVPCLVIGFELDVDTCAARSREVAQVLPNAEHIEMPGLAHAAPITDGRRVWPLVVSFLQKHHPPS